MPSPELGAGPIPRVSWFCRLGWSNPLPFEMQSPELGAGPTALLADAIPQTMLAKSKTNIAIPIFFMFFPPFLNVRTI
jgi:hypothetical protein